MRLFLCWVALVVLIGLVGRSCGRAIEQEQRPTGLSAAQRLEVMSRINEPCPANTFLPTLPRASMAWFQKKPPVTGRAAIQRNRWIRRKGGDGNYSGGSGYGIQWVTL